MDMQEMLDPFSRLLDDLCESGAVRAVEAGGDATLMWRGFLESGFLDALVDEADGGAGLSLTQAAPLMAMLGRFAVPLPVGETMIARALLRRAGMEVPEGPIAIVTGTNVTPFAVVAAHFLVGSQNAPRLVTAKVRTTGFFGDTAAYASVGGGERLRPLAAILRALLISGAADRVMEMTVAYANERHQFGKPIGKQQAVQQQLAVLAEQAVAARIAGAIGARGGLTPRLIDAAVAKHGASVAAVQVAVIAHAVHGAIGISAEYDLQLLTRRLYEWRLADGSEAYWAMELGSARAASGDAPTTDFIRHHGRPIDA